MRIFLFFLFPVLLTAQTITIDNESPRRTVRGDTVDAHDGRVIQFGETYYWYGTRYGNTSGFTTANHYVCYSSDDLTSWTYEGKLLPNQEEGVYYRPHVIYHAPSRRYVLWYNWYPKLWDGQFGVATSDKPTGPFTVQNPDVQMKHSDIGLGDFGLFVDDDGTAYLAYNTIQDHQVSIERLAPDYLSSTQENGGFLAKHCEAGSMFKRNGWYYLLTDYTCCFCGEGSGARVYMSKNPLSGYEQRGNINRLPGVPRPHLTDGEFNRFGTSDVTPERGFLVETDRPFDAVRLTFAWKNYRTHCRPDDVDFVHPDDILPRLNWFENQQPLRTERSPQNDYAHLTLTYRLADVQTAPVRFKLDSSAYATYQLAEVTPMRHGVALAHATVYELGIGQPPVIPSQQTHIMELQTDRGTEYLWMGDLWGSRPDNVKGHDQQYWSAPLRFRPDGTIERMSWTGRWSFGKP